MTEERKAQLEKNFQWEKEKHDQFFLPWYKENGIEVVKDNVGRGYAEYDTMIRKDERIWRVDEKAIRGFYENIYVEILQDIKTGSLGWIYTKQIDILFWTFWNHETDDRPRRAYWIEKPKVLEYVATNFRKLEKPETRPERLAYGDPFSVLVSCYDLVYLGMAKQIL